MSGTFLPLDRTQAGAQERTRQERAAGGPEDERKSLTLPEGLRTRLGTRACWEPGHRGSDGRKGQRGDLQRAGWRRVRPGPK